MRAQLEQAPTQARNCALSFPRFALPFNYRRQQKLVEQFSALVEIMRGVHPVTWANRAGRREMETE
jgi:hypothetical protein